MAAASLDSGRKQLRDCVPSAVLVTRRSLLPKCQVCRGQTWHSGLTIKEPVLCSRVLGPCSGWMLVFGEQQGGVGRELKRARSALYRLC